MLIQALINTGMYNGIENVPWYFLASRRKKRASYQKTAEITVFHITEEYWITKKNLSFLLVVNVMLLNVPYEGFSGCTK